MIAVVDASPDVITDVVDRLELAARAGRAIPPVRAELGTADITTAYAVQRELTSRRLREGAVVVGRKVGLTSPAVQAQLGVDQPDFGVLFADMDASGRSSIPSERLVQPKVEAEVAFVLREDLADGELDDAQVRAAIGHASAALEIVDSRIADWDISIIDTVADNASSGLFVLSDHELALDDFDPRAVRMRLFRDGEVVSEGDGTACLGDPVNALTWLARTARTFGEPLRTGQIVLSGALGPMVPARPGEVFRAELSSLGEITAAFSEGTA